VGAYLTTITSSATDQILVNTAQDRAVIGIAGSWSQPYAQDL